MEYSQTYLPFSIEMALELRNKLNEILKAYENSMYKQDVDEFFVSTENPRESLLDYIGLNSTYGVCGIYIEHVVPDKVKDFIIQCHAIAHTSLLAKYFSM